jgi:hypothetical protein
VDGWEPSFPEDVEDDAAVGTVFVTEASGHHATWVVVDRDGDRRIRYARVVTGRDAGTVEVSLAPDGDGTSVTVTYQLTALTPTGEGWLAEFVDGYPEFMKSWERALAARAGQD